MKNIRSLITILLIIMGLSFCVNMYADTIPSVRGKKHFRLHYVINSTDIDSSFVDNSSRILDINEFLSEVSQDSLIKITGVNFRGTASPDGPYEFNVKLSQDRLTAFKELIRNYLEIPDSIIFSQSSEIPWDEFRLRVVEGEVPMKDKVLAIIDGPSELIELTKGKHIDSRLIKLKQLDGGKVWEELKYPILFELRYGDAVFEYDHRFPHMPRPSFMAEQTLINVPDFLPIPERTYYDTWVPRIYLKTNLLGWAMASANLGVEFDLAPHWSLTLPAYYSAVDYFKSTIKFRNITFQPEIRYWPNAKGDNHGFFVGAHFGMMYYNFAVDGPYRYQDHDGKTPALGGGIGIGYRKAISKNKRWHIEFTAGAGAYHLDYDVFENTPNYKDGPLVRRKKKTFIGLDQAAISVTYNFPLSKCERTYRKGGEL